jgi:hypothetical protein
MYNTVLSLYSINDDSPLPQSDEVLLCTPQTTLDMVSNHEVLQTLYKLCCHMALVALMIYFSHISLFQSHLAICATFLYSTYLKSRPIF